MVRRWLSCGLSLWRRDVGGLAAVVAGVSANSRASFALAGFAFDGCRTIWSVTELLAVSLASR
jgi:hypothetical protein